jgi:hypothetical protein
LVQRHCCGEIGHPYAGLLIELTQRPKLRAGYACAFLYCAEMELGGAKYLPEFLQDLQSRVTLRRPAFLSGCFASGRC